MDVHRANRRDRFEPGVERQLNEEVIDPTADPEAMYLEKEKEKGSRDDGRCRIFERVTENLGDLALILVE